MDRRTARRMALAFVLLPSAAGAQLVVTNTMTPEQLVQNVLLGAGVTVTNVTFNGLPANTVHEQAGAFDGTNANVGLPDGMMLATGDVTFAVGPNNTGSGSLGGNNFGFNDADLDQLSGVPTNDAAILEFDFIPTGDSLKFNYVFGSEEYDEYVCGTVNDVFGFFLSGPGINGPFTNNAINIALVPGTLVPVSINTVNNGTVGAFGIASNCAALDPGWQGNSVYYTSNANGTTVQYDGMTVVLTARAQVTCGQTYHIKIAIADGGDTVFDSGVFLEGGSFTSNPFTPALEPGPGVFGDAMYESCFPVTLNFVRTGDISQPDTVYLTYGGTATPGVDYVPALPGMLVFAGGQSLIPFQITVPMDPDGDETIEITLLVMGGCNGQPVEVTYTFHILSVPPLQVTATGATAACGQPVDLTAAVTGGFGLYDLQWSTGDTGSVITLTAFGGQIISVIATDTCGLAPDTALATITLAPPPPIGLSIIGPAALVEGCDLMVVRVTRPQGTIGPLTVQMGHAGTAINGTDHTAVPAIVSIPDGSGTLDLPVAALNDGAAEGPETATLTATYTNACGQTVTASVQFTITDPAPIILLGDDVTGGCTDSLMLTVAATGGTQPLGLMWADGTAGTVVWVPGNQDGTYAVTATDACGQTATLALQVDADCAIVIPNVFSPNGDGYNDRFEIDGIRSRKNRVRVYNRWGKLVLDAVNYRNTWEARDLSDGTYFYVVEVEGAERPYTGHLTVLGH